MFLSCIFFLITVMESSSADESDNEQPRQRTASDSFKKHLSGAKASLPTGKKQTVRYVQYPSTFFSV